MIATPILVNGGFCPTCSSPPSPSGSRFCVGQTCTNPACIDNPSLPDEILVHFAQRDADRIATQARLAESRRLRALSFA